MTPSIISIALATISIEMGRITDELADDTTPETTNNLVAAMNAYSDLRDALTAIPETGVQPLSAEAAAVRDEINSKWGGGDASTT